jgi:hypothetical protein
VAQIERVLAAAQGKTAGPERLCLVTIIGVRFFTPSGYVVIAPRCEPFAVYATGPNDAKPTEEQLAECIRLWSTFKAAPDFYTFPQGSMPTIPETPIPTTTNKETDQ